MSTAVRFLLLGLAISTTGCSFLPINQKLSTDEASTVVADIEHTTEVTEEPAKPDDLWQRVRNGYQLTYDDHKRIQTHLNWYKKNQRYLDRISQRASRYLHFIVEEMESRDLPLELALLPVVESAFDPFAYSHGRASGMWQFIPATARNFGLKKNWWYDGRRDVEASTIAALDFLTYLNKRFDGDWLLALAAYNTGEGNVRKAVKRNRRKGRSTAFWDLRLPRETRAYVPQLLALSQIVADPEAHGVSLKPIANTAHFKRIEIGAQMDLAQAAEMAEIDIDDLYLLNPGYNRWATAPSGPHHILLPVDKAEAFEAKLSMIPASEWVTWKRYTIKPGDSLITIAKRHHTSVTTLKNANNLRSNRIRAGKSLLIPQAAAPANHYSMSVDQRLQKRQSTPGKSGAEKVVHIVQAGDSFWKLSRRYQVGINELARWNNMAPKDRLQQGQKLVVWTRQKITVAQRIASRSQKSMTRKVAYQVRRGDSLARIASKFRLSIKDILRWNPINKNHYLQPGQSLTLFVDITRAN